MNKVLAFVIAQCCFASALSAQWTISGKVCEQTSETCLYGASVYTPEAYKGCITDSAGLFRITGLHTGNITLQFSFVGYQTKVISMLLTKDTAISIQLSESALTGKEVVITGFNSNDYNSLTSNITSLSQNEMRENGTQHLTEALSRLPGIGQLSTGSGIAKPVIRGLYGNRIQTVLMGMRFDNQQWQDEHGLGLSDAGIDKVEIIRGPSALLFGSEAMGGVVNIIEEKPAPNGQLHGSVSTRFFSNTMGFSTDAGIAKANDKINWRVRASYESHGDYEDGAGIRVLNSRWEGYNLKSTIGVNRKNFTSQNYLMGSFNQYGFVMEDNIDRKPVDNRYSRTMDGPKHLVAFGVFNSENTFYRGENRIKFNVGLNVNSRMENEGGSRVSLHMLLNTFQAKAIWTRRVFHIGEVTAGSSFMFQTNTNFGSRVIVPDARMGEGSLFAHLKVNFRLATLEGGIRYDLRGIGTSKTLNYNSPGDSIFPYVKIRNAVNGSLGMSVHPGKYFYVKANVSSGFRSGNLAELASNGLHEGTYRFEVGDPNLRTEQNINSEVLLGVQHEQVTFSVAAYYNHFLNYIYLSPTGRQIYGFDIFEYEQANARYYGTEADLSVNPFFAKWLEVAAGYSLVRGTLMDGENLPFIPADKVQGSVKFVWKQVKVLRQLYAKIGGCYTFRQRRPAQFETNTSDYFLLDASIGTTVKIKKYSLLISVAGNNLTGKIYADHLSRFKYYGINNIGRNINLNLSFQF